MGEGVDESVYLWEYLASYTQKIKKILVSNLGRYKIMFRDLR
jgi:hypothetical protein